MANKLSVPGVKEKTVFYILLALLVVPASIFIAQSYFQLEKILQEVDEMPVLSSKQYTSSDGFEDDNSLLLTKSKIALEHDVLKMRHQRTTAFIATRTWMRFMSLMFGAILIVIGSGFVLGRITSPSYEGKVSAKEIGASFASSSPGLLLVICGMILIAIPNVSNQQISTVDASTYLAGSANPATPDPTIRENDLSDLNTKLQSQLSDDEHLKK